MSIQAAANNLAPSAPRAGQGSSAGPSAGVDWYKRPKELIVKHLDTINKSPLARMTSRLKDIFKDKAAVILSERKYWEGWSNKHVKVKTFAFFTPMLRASCALLESASPDVFPRVLAGFSDNQLAGLHHALLGTGLAITCANAAELLDMADRLRYTELERALRAFLKRVAEKVAGLAAAGLAKEDTKCTEAKEAAAEQYKKEEAAAKRKWQAAELLADEQCRKRQAVFAQLLRP
ncbi:hypothetical protein ABPG75_011441 [Micractinium tetrahymenae]